MEFFYPPFSRATSLTILGVHHLPSTTHEAAKHTANNENDSSTQHAVTAEDVLVWLPIISRKKNYEIFLVEEDIERFLKHDLDVSRLNRIHGYLWMAGRPLNSRTLVR